MCLVNSKTRNKLFGPANTKKLKFFLKKCKEWCFFALKWCFLALGGHLQPPLPYFEGAGLKEACVSSIQSLVTSFLGRPASKNSNFSSKKCKNGVFCLEMVLSGPGWSPAAPPYPILRVLDSKPHVSRQLKASQQAFQARQHQQTPIFPQKNAKNGFFLP